MLAEVNVPKANRADIQFHFLQKKAQNFTEPNG